ncbi:MAG: NAD(P)/FAD-dependent oxidoreductase [Myxococcota bacterium]
MSAGSQRIRVLAIELALDEVAAGRDAAADALLCARGAQAIGIDASEVRSARIARRALDARRRGGRHELRFVCHVDFDLDADTVARSAPLAKALKAGRAKVVTPPVSFALESLDSDWRKRRVAVVGSGPAGLYAAWCLASNGVAVDLIERGPALRERGRAVAHFTRTRELDPERNLLFGEGGAGTYSDGKLYTRTQHDLEAPIIASLIEAGADPQIAFDSRAHVGTDRLHRILPRLRAQLESMGVTFHFETRLEGFEQEGAGRVRALRTNRGEMLCDGVMLALGHSARDTLRGLVSEGLVAMAKPFQIGLRIEHPQSLVDRGRFGEHAGLPQLGHAYYALVAKATKETPAVHSFCMCPGGQVVAAVAQPGLLCTNGMSNSKHSSPYANSGLVVTLGPREFGEGVFAGVEFQEKLEAEFFAAAGGDYSVPAQRVPDFLAGRGSSTLPRSSYKLGASALRVDELLPTGMTAALRAGIQRFDRQLPGYAGEEGLLVGVESRSSGPLRLPRDPVTRLAEGFENVWPVGEGAGYAGGIMSAAIDGARSAWALLGHRE